MSPRELTFRRCVHRHRMRHVLSHAFTHADEFFEAIYQIEDVDRPVVGRFAVVVHPAPRRLTPLNLRTQCVAYMIRHQSVDVPAQRRDFSDQA